MKSFDEFIEIFQSRFWRKLKETIVPFEEIPKGKAKKKFLKDFYENLQEKNYQPKSPREYIVFDKHNLVSRIVPTFEIQDYVVYFYCVKALEPFIAETEDRIPGTFGGWTLSNGLRDGEKDEITELESQYLNSAPYGSDTSYNPLAWRRHWQQFQKLAYDYANQTDFGYALKFDIANFYDCINLNLLEEKIRTATTGADHYEDVSLLFHFLRQWNKPLEGYFPKTVGIPQDEIQDCSRILANFYLRVFDNEMYKSCRKKKSKYLRYSDDMILFCPSKKEALSLIFYASKELHKIGLNINSSKVDTFENREKFNEYWAFEIFELLEDENIKDKKTLNEAVALYFEKYQESPKRVSILRRLLAADFEVLNKKNRSLLKNEYVNKEFLSNCDYRMMKKIYNKMNEESANHMVSLLTKLTFELNYNSFHYNYRKFREKVLKIDELDIEKMFIESKIEELKLF
ncbi:RNA-directed DNA polymerase [Rhodohalobacter sp. 8-1]|uniref:RNA-directed DNA polymerase n=1 Tax=Rhodohalobacter sp. 8-1 TaxID=3131972 RepID=UPI0030EF1A0C